jgi:hypothetical protein
LEILWKRNSITSGKKEQTLQNASTQCLIKVLIIKEKQANKTKNINLLELKFFIVTEQYNLQIVGEVEFIKELNKQLL